MQQLNSDPSISVVTATLNAETCLPRLIESLTAQVDSGFAWVIADGDSTDSTIEMINSARDHLKIILLKESDDGIYSALNRAIQAIETEYYLVVGADDVLTPNAVLNFRKEAKRCSSFVDAGITIRGKAKRRRMRIPWLYGQFAYVRSHAVGLLIRTELHRSFGLYSVDYKSAADQEFILRCMRGGASLHVAGFTAGEFSTDGTSGQNVLTALLEGYRAQIVVGFNPVGQSLLLAARLIRHRKRIHNQILMSRTHGQRNTI